MEVVQNAALLRSMFLKGALQGCDGGRFPGGPSGWEEAVPGLIFAKKLFCFEDFKCIIFPGLPFGLSRGRAGFFTRFFSAPRLFVFSGDSGALYPAPLLQAPLPAVPLFQAPLLLASLSANQLPADSLKQLLTIQPRRFSDLSWTVFPRPSGLFCFAPSVALIRHQFFSSADSHFFQRLAAGFIILFVVPVII